MPNDSEERVSRILQEFGNRDPKLETELRGKFHPGLGLEKLGEPVFRIPEGIADVGDRSKFLESIVKAHARPVLLIRDNRFVPEFVGPDSEVWKERLDAASEKINSAIPSVGRVEVQNNPDYNWLGTAWLVAEDIVVTNRHVAREFARSGTDGFVFRASGRGPMSSSIDFLEEFDRGDQLGFPVSAILWIAPETDEDIAFLRSHPNLAEISWRGQSRSPPAPYLRTIL